MYFLVYYGTRGWPTPIIGKGCVILKLKAIIPLTLSFTLIFSATAGVVGASESDLKTVTSSQTKRLTTSDGVDMGYVTKNTTIEYNKTKEGLEFTVTTDSDYTLNSEFASIEEYSNKFSDGVDVDKYLITGDNKIYADGELIKPSSFSIMDSGGVPEISHYYDDGSYNRYYFNSYSDIRIQWTMDIKPSGSHISKSALRTNPMFYSAKSAVDSFEDNYDDYNFNVKATMIALGLTAISWETLVGAIAAGAAAGQTAAAAVDSYNDAKEDVNDAYSYINQL